MVFISKIKEKTAYLCSVEGEKIQLDFITDHDLFPEGLDKTIFYSPVIDKINQLYSSFASWGNNYYLHIQRKEYQKKA